MKLRIKGNSLRFRLTEPDVEKLTKEGSLEERTQFGTNELLYSLHKLPGSNEMTASFNGNKISLFIPESFLKDWFVNDVVGFQSQMPLSSSGSLSLLLEKDFTCLEESVEDQSDNYRNPKSICQP